MKYLFSILAIFSGLLLTAQTQNEPVGGTISYITSQNIYVRFDNTDKIKIGDTLYIKPGNKLIPALVVKDLSSLSCLCTSITDTKLNVSDKVFHKTVRPPSAKAAQALPPVVTPPLVHPIDTSKYKQADTTRTSNVTTPTKQQIHGFVQAASFTNWSNNTSTNSQGEKFTFSLNARDLANTDLSAECYIAYVINNKQYNQTKNSIFNQLKIYNFAFSYDFGKKATLWAGRKINPNLSNMGANDGVQFEMRFKPLSFGVIAGFRPDYADYGFSSTLFQFGGYLFNEYIGKQGRMGTTLGFINQMNSGKTDRRFLYLQHTNTLIKRLTFFGSVEMDLYEKKFNSQDSSYTSANNPKLTNLYVSLGYRFMMKLNVSASYSARHSVIYYETYKNYLDQVLNNEVLQGYLLQANYSPIANLSIGATLGYRFQKSDPKPTQNLYGYVSYNDIPVLKIAATGSVVILNTGYQKGKIYSVGISKNLAQGKLYAGLTYRYVDYHYYSTEIAPTYQNMGEANLTWRIIHKLSFSAYYEGTFEKLYKFNRIYAQLNWSF